MRKLLLLVMLYTGVAQAQLDHVSLGYGGMTFPSGTQGGTAYLGIGGEEGGAMLFIGGDSRIMFGGEEYGSGMVGLAGFRDLKINEWLEVGAFAGITAFETHQAVNITPANTAPADPFFRSKLKETNIQPYGGVRLVVQGWIEIQYAPISNMLTFGVKLYKH